MTREGHTHPPTHTHTHREREREREREGERDAETDRQTDAQTTEKHTYSGDHPEGRQQGRVMDAAARTRGMRESLPLLRVALPAVLDQEGKQRRAVSRYRRPAAVDDVLQEGKHGHVRVLLVAERALPRPQRPHRHTERVDVRRLAVQRSLACCCGHDLCTTKRIHVVEQSTAPKTRKKQQTKGGTAAVDDEYPRVDR